MPQKVYGMLAYTNAKQKKNSCKASQEKLNVIRTNGEQKTDIVFHRKHAWETQTYILSSKHF
jgi:hypothetical protein